MLCVALTLWLSIASPAPHEVQADIDTLPVATNRPMGAPWANPPPRPSDVQQGDLGDCGVLAAMAAVAHVAPYLVQRNLIVQDANHVVLRLYRPQNDFWVPVIVRMDDTVPMRGGRPVFASGQGTASGSPRRSGWAGLYEKAFVALYTRTHPNLASTYEALDSQVDAQQAFGYLTGLAAGKLPLHGGAPIEALLALRDASQSATTATTLAQPGPDLGLVPKHAYTVLRVFRDVQDGGVRVVLRNPMGDRSPQVSDSHNFRHGVVLLRLEEFMQSFRYITVLRASFAPKVAHSVAAGLAKHHG